MGGHRKSLRTRATAEAPIPLAGRPGQGDRIPALRVAAKSLGTPTHRKGATRVSALALSAVGLLIAVSLWLLWGVLRAVRNVLAERAAYWLLPPQQPVTFRLAQFLTFFAQAVAPRRYPSWALHDPTFAWGPAWHMILPIEWCELYWREPEAMRAELEADLRAERQVLDPVRLVLPLFGEALNLRFFYSRKFALYLCWIPYGLLVYSAFIAISALNSAFKVEHLARNTWGKGRRRLRGWGFNKGR